MSETTLNHEEVTMSTTDARSDAAATGTVDLELEVVVLPVADVDRAKRFYSETLGWRLDADFAAGEQFRVVQVTPPGSPAAVIFGTGITSAAPGSVDSLILVVDDLEAARGELVARGVEVSEIFHDEGGVFHHAGTTGRVPGPDPERGSYRSWAAFDDPDGNGWLLQEITSRLPGRVAVDVGGLAELLRETSEHHGAFEAIAPPHDWWDWYAPYFNARRNGGTPEEAEATADLYMKETRGVAVSR
jgi:catechol 2,3-dioxygenase-like lactoylglutathione lyase family enzyme